MWKKRIAVVLILLWTLCLPVMAQALPDAERTDCAITITTIPSGRVTLYRIGELERNGGVYAYAYTEVFAGCPYDLTELADARAVSALAKNIWNYATLLSPTAPQTYVIQNGTVTMDQLSTGLYLIGQTADQVGEQLDPIAPFLVTVPYETEQGWLYQVNASPKVSASTEPPEIPPTGQLNWPIPMLALSGLLLFMLGYALRYCERKNDNET